MLQDIPPKNYKLHMKLAVFLFFHYGAICQGYIHVKQVIVLEAYRQSQYESSS